MERIEDQSGLIYMTCSACMSVWADGLSWANANKGRITKSPEDAQNIVVLSCQVTDLAILSDLRTIESLRDKYPNRNYFISGCLAMREDIELPDFVKRLETPRTDYQVIDDKTLVSFEPPFWVPDFKEDGKDTDDGHLFRDMYPLRIGKGCPGKCTYCTIRVTRGSFEKYDATRLEAEFLMYEDILLVADSPTKDQVQEWCDIAVKHNKPFSIRNVEPHIAVQCKNQLIELAQKGLIKAFHSPVQSTSPDVLRDMGRSVKDVEDTMFIAEVLSGMEVYIATNIIIDYKEFEQDFTRVYSLYDYVSFNPLWDGKWNREEAERRQQKYITK